MYILNLLSFKTKIKNIRKKFKKSKTNLEFMMELISSALFFLGIAFSSVFSILILMNNKSLFLFFVSFISIFLILSLSITGYRKIHNLFNKTESSEHKKISSLFEDSVKFDRKDIINDSLKSFTQEEKDILNNLSEKEINFIHEVIKKEIKENISSYSEETLSEILKYDIEESLKIIILEKLRKVDNKKEIITKNIVQI